MRKLLGIALGGILALGVAGQSQAATEGFTGTLSVAISALDPISIPGSGTATLNGSAGVAGSHLTSLGIPAGAFASTQFLLVTDPAASPILGVEAAAANASGSFVFPGSPSGTMGLPGAATVCLFSSDCFGGPGTPLVVPFTQAGVGVGFGGAVTAMGGGIKVTVAGAPWTINSTVAGSGPIGGPFTFGTQAGFSHGPASATSSTVAASGVVSLVTSIQITTSIGPSGSLPAFAIMTLHFAPEPGALLLLGAGIVGFVALGRKRMRH